MSEVVEKDAESEAEDHGSRVFAAKNTTRSTQNDKER